MTMRLLLGAAALAAAISFSEGPARAQVGGYPWCAVVNLGTGSIYWDCHYRTVEECVPNVLAGNRGHCNPNPAWEGWYAPQARPHVRHKRHVRTY